MEMSCEQSGSEEEARIVLFVLIPRCKHCRDTVEREIMSLKYWERVEIGYPDRDGSPVSLIYRKGKFPDVDYWKLAKRAKERLNEWGYRVL